MITYQHRLTLSLIQVNETHSGDEQMNKYRSEICRLEAALALAEQELSCAQEGKDGLLSPGSQANVMKELEMKQGQLLESQLMCDRMETNVARMKQLIKMR